MSIQDDGAGRRFISVEAEVPGSPELVWSAIASGPGISSWFVPTQFEADATGKAIRVISNFGPGMESRANVSAWEPPTRFTADSKDFGPEAPAVSTEWRVDAHDGDSCTVRVTHSVRTEESAWDGTLESWEKGWPDFFRLLRLYMQNFPGDFSSSFQTQCQTQSSRRDAWGQLARSLGLDGAGSGDSFESQDGAPDLRGRLEDRDGSAHPEEALLRLEAPHAGLGHAFALDLAGKTLISVRLHFFGDGKEAACREAEAAWKEWLPALYTSHTGTTS